jgi:hypothetical protein
MPPETVDAEAGRCVLKISTHDTPVTSVATATLSVKLMIEQSSVDRDFRFARIYRTDWTAKTAQQSVQAGASGAIPKSAEFQRFATVTDSAPGHVADTRLQDDRRQLGAGADG